LKAILKAKNIPNMLSVSRIFFGVALPFLSRYTYALLGCLAAIGISDVLDGILARRFKWESALGEKLDSLADGVYIISAILSAIFVIKMKFTLYIYAILAVLMVGRALNMVITWFKFRRAGFIHTRSSRWASIPVFLLLSVSLVTGDVYNQALAVFLVLTTLSQVEETVILFAMKEGQYTMSLKSYWEWKRDLARAEALPEKKQEATA